MRINNIIENVKRTMKNLFIPETLEKNVKDINIIGKLYCGQCGKPLDKIGMGAYSPELDEVFCPQQISPNSEITCFQKAIIKKSVVDGVTIFADYDIKPVSELKELYIAGKIKKSQ